MKLCSRSLLTILLTIPAVAQTTPPVAQPPAKVTVCAVAEGTLAPSKVWPGNVYYKEVSSLATEVEGKVVEVSFEEGQHIDKGAVLVRLDYSILESELHAAQAAVLQADTQAQLESARLERAKSLLKDEVTTPQEYDDIRFTVQAAEHKVTAAKAEVERIERTIEKKTIRAPFTGRVIDRKTELGDWKSAGDVVAVFARDDLFDVIVNIDEVSVPHAAAGATVDVSVGGKSFPGTIVAVIPKGDVVARQFPVKIRVEKQDWLLEGMSAQVNMPAGAERKCLVVPRDALLQEGSQHVVYRVENGQPVRSVVDVVAYSGLMAGVEGPGIKPGVQIITKGQERLRAGQPIEVVQPS